jgi:hypothetical protein
MRVILALVYACARGQAPSLRLHRVVVGHVFHLYPSLGSVIPLTVNPSIRKYFFVVVVNFGKQTKKETVEFWRSWNLHR